MTHGNHLTEEGEALGELPRQVAVTGGSDPPVEFIEHGLPDHPLPCDVPVFSLPRRIVCREERFEARLDNQRSPAAAHARLGAAMPVRRRNRLSATPML